MPINPTPAQPPTPESPVDEQTTVGDNMTSENSVPVQDAPDQQLESPSMTFKKPTPVLMALLVIVPIVAGVATGFGLQQLFAQGSGSSQTGQLSDGRTIERVPTDTINIGDVFGSPDESTFKDQAEGVLQIGGFDGEGSHQLVRPGGESQTVYLTSSVTDLDQFQDMEVKVWGETFKGQKVGWLMDVGRIEVLATEAELPE